MPKTNYDKCTLISFQITMDHYFTFPGKEWLEGLLKKQIKDFVGEDPDINLEVIIVKFPKDPYDKDLVFYVETSDYSTIKDDKIIRELCDKIEQFEPRISLTMDRIVLSFTYKKPIIKWREQTNDKNCID